MNVFVTGGSGFVGSHLIPFLLSRGHRVLGSGTSKTSSLGEREGYTYISADTTRSGDWQEALTSVDAVINLAGRNIFQTLSSQKARPDKLLAAGFSFQYAQLPSALNNCLGH